MAYEVPLVGNRRSKFEAQYLNLERRFPIIMRDTRKAINTQLSSRTNTFTGQQPGTKALWMQQAISYLIVLVGLGYLVLIPSGVIKKKLEPVDVGILATIILANSGVIARIKKLSISKDGFDIESAIDEIDKKVDSNKEDFNNEIKALEQKYEQEKKDNLRLMKEIDLHLSGTVMQASNFRTFKTLMENAAPEVSEYVYQKTKDFRHRVSDAKRKAQKREVPYGKRGEIERTIDVFRALIEQEQGKKRHQFYAQLGYALKDQGNPEKEDWEEAEHKLDKAIELWRKEEDNKFSKLPPYYCFNWITCIIELYHQADVKAEYSETEKKRIEKRLKAAIHCPQLATALQCQETGTNEFKSAFDQWSKAQSSWLDVNKIIQSSTGSCHRVPE